MSTELVPDIAWTPEFTRVAEFTSKIHNARHGEIVSYVEDMYEDSAWRDYQLPGNNSPHYRWREFEFDYFLAVAGVDPVQIRDAYAGFVKQLPAEGSRAELRMAFLTGKAGASVEQRRPWRQVVKELDGDPFGADKKIEALGLAGFADLSGTGYVVRSAGAIARDPERRKLVKQGKGGQVRRQRMSSWRVTWTDNRSLGDAIADKLLANPALARHVYKRLRNTYDREANKRRSGA